MKKMKKMMMGFATCALLFTSCSQNEITTENSVEKAIGFSNLNDRLTKAANDADDDYSVFAVRSDAENVWYMYNVKVEVDGSTNSYSPLRYWPKDGNTVNFYAFAPFDANIDLDASDDPEDGLPLVYTVPTTANEDFTIAQPITGASPAVSSTVALSFSHMLSKVTISAILQEDLANAGYTISFRSASLTVAKNQGSTSLMTKAALTPAGTSATYENAKSYMFIPQNSVNSTIQLKEVVIQHNGVNYWTGDMIAYTVATSDITGDKFNANTHYQITFTINSSSKDESNDLVFDSVIQFSSSIAADWGRSTVDINQPL